MKIFYELSIMFGPDEWDRWEYYKIEDAERGALEALRNGEIVSLSVIRRGEDGPEFITFNELEDSR